MSFDTELAKNSNTPVILFQMLKAGEVLDFWSSYSAHVYFINLDVYYPNIEPELIEGVTSEGIKDIDKVFAGSSELSRADSTGLDEGEFYYSDRNLYVRLDNNSRPTLHIMTVDVVYLSLRKGGETSYYNDVYYADRLESIPSLSRNKEDIFNSITSYGGGPIVVTNNDGLYDNLFEEDIVLKKNRVNLLFGFDGLDYTEFQQRFTAYVESVNVGVNTMRINSRDVKKKLNTPVTPNVFNMTDYPDILEDNIDKVIPIAYGQLESVPVLCVNDEESPTPANYTFKICDTTYHSIKDIAAVFVDGSSVAFGNENLTAATFTIANANYTPGQDVTVTMEGYVDGSGDLIENAIEIIKDILINYTDAEYTATYFNFAHWETDRAFSINLFINENAKINDAIDEIVKSSLITFIVEDDGRYGARIFDSGGATTQKYESIDILDYYNVDYDIEKMITSVIVDYNPKYSDETYLSYLDDTEEAELVATYDYYDRKEFETSLTISTEAQEYATKILDEFGLLYKTFTIDVRLDSIYREVGDIIEVTLARPTAPDLGTFRCEIIGINKNFNDFEISLTCRPFERLTAFVDGQAAYYYDFGGNDLDPIFWNDDTAEEVSQIYSINNVYGD